MHCAVKTAERIIEILSPADRPIILVFRHRWLLRKSDGFIPKGGAEYKGVAIFDQYAAWLYLRNGNRYRCIFTIEDEYKVVCVLSNGAAFDDLD